ncbi:prolyl 4-hydroxylase [Bacillus iocasae]|uniref:Prolyl 4-hydroxylase n=2 Tax=Priestia iocasae TaxID=2291674 RepID=A0ABS2QSP5_9BACI|nr:2OG-Fe(II) oxygenase [Metabacillus iocasae]MBM7702052.1 prolyl 4-hydroxylase [Metabacillus iocasae]
MLTSTLEKNIFEHQGSKIKIEQQEVQIIARYEQPLVVVLDHVLTNEECDRLITLSQNRLARSKIGASKHVNDIRTSSSMFFDENENEFIGEIEQRISALMCVPVEHGEGIQILHYAPEQQFKAHHDYFVETSRAAANNRISTLIMYLNDVEEGGETLFPELNLSISPRKGMGVYFEYFYNDSLLNKQTLHAGMPVVKGEKWVATQWMRRKPYRV